MEYKKGDWVVLGQSGGGWADKHRCVVCQIEDIGPHLRGTLHSDSYDFYVKYDEKVFGLDYNGKRPQITRGPETRGGGNSNNIHRHALTEEIPVDLMRVLTI